MMNSSCGFNDPIYQPFAGIHVRACAIGKPNVSTQQIFDLESDFGKGSDGERVAAAQRKTGLVTFGSTISEDENPVVREIFDPDFRNLKARVDGKLHVPILSQRRVGNLEHQKHIFAGGM